jgi:hypothetical protein
VLGHVRRARTLRHYVHDFVRMAHSPTPEGGEEEYRLMEALVAGECLGGGDAASLLAEEGAAEALARIHVRWAEPAVAASVARLRTVLAQVPAVAAGLRDAAAGGPCTAVGLEGAAASLALKALAPRAAMLRSRRQVLAWVGSVRGLRGVMEDILAGEKAGAGGVGAASSAADFVRLQIAAMFAGGGRLRGSTAMTQLWAELRLCDDIPGGRSLARLVRFLGSRARALGVADEHAGSFLAEAAETFFRPAPLRSAAVRLTPRVDVRLEEGGRPAGEEPPAVRLDGRARAALLGVLVDAAYDADGDAALRDAAAGRLRRLLCPPDGEGGGGGAEPEALEAFGRAAERFLGARCGSYSPAMLARAGERLRQPASSPDHVFGVASAQQGLTYLVDALFAAARPEDVELPEAVTLCAAPSPFRERCREYLVAQVAHRHGARALGRLAGPPGLRWVGE